MQTKTLRVQGMTCRDCADRVEQALERIRGVTSVFVDYRAGRAVVESTPNVADSELIGAVESSGYRADIDSAIDSPAPTAAPPENSKRGWLVGAGAVGAGLLASLCCIGPLLVVTLGVGAGLASTFAPLRPLFTAVTVLLIALGFYVVYGRKRANRTCAPGEACEPPAPRKRDQVFLWVAVLLATTFLTFEYWSQFLF